MALYTYLRLCTSYHNSLGRLIFFEKISWMLSQSAARCLTPLPYYCPTKSPAPYNTGTVHPLAGPHPAPSTRSQVSRRACAADLNALLVQRINLVQFSADMDQLWAEAVVREQAGEAIIDGQRQTVAWYRHSSHVDDGYSADQGDHGWAGVGLWHPSPARSQQVQEGPAQRVHAWRCRRTEG
jgi:hypothetical protein